MQDQTIKTLNKKLVNAESNVTEIETAITGACEFGVKSFCESIKVPKKLVVSDVIRLTQGKYGNEVFKKFFR